MPHRIRPSKLSNVFHSARDRRRPLVTRGPRTRKAFVELLEDRCLLSTYLVSNTNYSGTDSLGAAISAALAANDSAAVITISLPANSTILLNSGDVNSAAAAYGPTAFFIGTNITIDGSETPGLVIDGGNAVRPFVVPPNGALTLENLTLADGNAKGGAGAGEYYGGGGAGAGLGGAVFSEGAFVADDCTFVNNSAQGGNGGNAQGVDTLTTGGGGGGGLGSTSPGEGHQGGGLNGGAPYKNGGFGGGGGGGGEGLVPETKTAATGPGGSGGFGGGGGGGGAHFLEDISDNGGNGGFGGGGGGSGYNPDGSDNGHPGIPGFGGGGGGIVEIVSDQTRHLTENFGPGGGGAGMGGGIFSNGGTITLTNDTFTGNTASGGAGGIVTSTFAPVNETGGSGSGYGGAIFTLNGQIFLDDDTISGNTAAQGGAGVYLLGNGANATATINNTIIGQSATSVADFVANTINSGTTTTSGFGNLIGTATGFSGTIVSTADPDVAALGSYGGPTQTMPPLPGSPAIDAGHSFFFMGVITDQRGEPREGNGVVDIGAVQTQGYTFTTAADTTPQSAPTGAKFAEPLAVTVTPNYANDPVNGGVITFIAPSSGASATLSATSATIAASSASVTATANNTTGAYTVTAKAGGVATVAEFSLTNNNRLVSIAVTPASPSIAKGLTEQFTATGTYSDGSTADLTSQVTWASATAAVATITSAGLATGAGIGSSQISATLGGTTSPSDTLTVTAAALTSIAVAPLSPSVVAGRTVYFTTTGYYTDGSTANLTTQVTWASGNASVAFIFNDGTGLCIGLAPGTTAITAALSGITSPSDTLTVTAPALTSIAVAPVNPSVALGLTEQFTATGTYTDGSTADLTSQVTWASATAAVATISNTAGSQGLASTLATGTTTITAALGGITSPSDTLTVTAATTGTVVVSSASTAVSGETVTFTATVSNASVSGSGPPTGSVQFLADGADVGAPVTLEAGVATLALNSLALGSHTIAADYTSNSPDFAGSAGTTSVTVEAATVTNIDAVISSAASSGESVIIQTTSSAAVMTALTAVNDANPASAVTVTLDLDGSTTAPTTAISAPSNVQLDLTSSSGTATVQGVTVSGGTVVVAASVAPVDWTVNGGNVTVEGSASAGDFVVNSGTVTLAGGTVITGNSPAVTLNGGTLILQGVTAQTATNAPTILVNGGSLTVRNSTIEESTGYAEAAILITGGSVDLGTSTSPGGNTFNVNGTGTLIDNTTASPVAAVGDTFENNGATVASNFGLVSLAAPPAQTANQGLSKVISLGSLTDTVTDSQSWAVDVNWGDGAAHTDFNTTATGPLTAQPHAFALPGTYTVTVTATDPADSRATAWDFVQSFTITVAPSILVLDPTAGGALSLSGSASISIPGAVVVDSSSSSAISASGSAQVKASVIDVHGGVQKSGNASFSPVATTGAQIVSDPLASLVLPGAPTLTYCGSESVSGNSMAMIGPGVYSQISVSGNSQLTMTAGTYIIQTGGFTASGNAVITLGAGSSIILEGGGLSVSGNAAIRGTGATIFNVGSNYNPSNGTDGGNFGAVTLSGNGAVSLTPPSSGTYAGILIYQARDNAKALTFSGNARQGITGTIYAPAAQLVESGNTQIGSTSSPVSIIVDTLTISGNSVANTVTLSSPTGTVAYTPAQIRAAYGISALALDGTGQTIAIVDAYDDPSIDQALDAFDSQFGLTASGPMLYQQYGRAASFLTVLNQSGQPTSLPSTDPHGPGTDNWEVEEALDVEWDHAIAPGAQIILVEANSESLSDLMAGVTTAAHQPGVSVVSMSWGFPEGQAVFAADEAAYDKDFEVPGVTFVASTGDYGAADPEYPAYSPNVLAVGGTSLTLNADNSYNSETGWGYYSNAGGAFIGSGGGISLYEPEPAYQLGIQSTGYRTTPDVSLVADPATGAWVADPYNLPAGDPFEVVGGTSLSAPAWAGLVALANQGRADAGESTLNSTSPTDTQQALYMLPQSDYSVIAGGTNGYSAGAGYNLVTGLGTPVANRLVPDLVAYHGPGTSYAGPTVGPLQNAGLVNTGTSNGGPMNVFSPFDSLTIMNNGFGSAQDVGRSGWDTSGADSPGQGTAAGAPVTPTAPSPATFLVVSLPSVVGADATSAVASPQSSSPVWSNQPPPQLMLSSGADGRQSMLSQGTIDTQQDDPLTLSDFHDIEAWEAVLEELAGELIGLRRP